MLRKLGISYFFGIKSYTLLVFDIGRHGASNRVITQNCIHVPFLFLGSFGKGRGTKETLFFATKGNKNEGVMPFLLAEDSCTLEGEGNTASIIVHTRSDRSQWVSTKVDCVEVSTNHDLAIRLTGESGDHLDNRLIFWYSTTLLDVVLHDFDLHAGNLSELTGNPFCGLG